MNRSINNSNPTDRAQFFIFLIFFSLYLLHDFYNILQFSYETSEIADLLNCRSINTANAVGLISILQSIFKNLKSYTISTPVPPAPLKLYGTTLQH